jgi:hypothetical protein
VSGSNRKNKSVSFDLDDEYEVEALEHAENGPNGKKRNFSKYVIRLISEDKKRGSVPSNNSTKVDDNHVSKEKDFYTMEVKDAMSTFY